MKTPSVAEVEPDTLEYKLKYTPDLRCEKQTDLVPVCYSCKSCILSWKIFSTREWFVRASQATQRTFVVGIINRFESHDLLKYSWNLLQAIDTKDFTYSRSCVSSTFRASSALDRAMDPQKLVQSMADLWRWFLGASFWTKANYILLLLQMCDSQLLLTAATLIRILLTEHESVATSENMGEEEEYVKRSKSDMRPLAPMKSATLAQMAENQFLSKASSVLGNIRVQKIWSKQSDSIFKKALCDLENETNYFAMLTLYPTTAPAFPQQSPNKFRDFIRYLPVHLSKSILRMLDMKTLARCASVSPHWNFLVKQLKCDVVANYALRSQISFFQALCPKGAISTFARIVKVAIPRITSNGDIILTKTKKQFKDYDQQQTTSQSEVTEYMQKAYHGQETDTVKLEERNVFCSAYNVRVLINSLDSNRVIHSTSGRLLAFGSLDRKIRFLDIEKIKTIPPVFSGHAGSIRTLYLNEERGFLLSGSYDLSIRLWNIRKGTCAKIFLGHKGNITCLDVCKTRFVSGSKDCTAKLWDMKTGRCIKTFTHKGYIWAAKMNDIHIVSSCEKGLVKIWHAESYVLIKV